MTRIADIELGEFPILLAPMEDVSDPPFRYVCKQHGADLVYTEFISAEGLIRNARKSMKKLEVFDYERPVGIQIFGADIDAMRVSTVIAEEAKPDLIDINYGCPVKNVACKGAGAGILQDVPKMIKMTKEIVDSTNLPVTVKTRLGWDDETRHIVEVAERLQDVGIKAISIHGRTRKQMFKGEADWTLIGEVKNNPRMHIPVFGNGDLSTVERVKAVKNRYGVDGVMVGRAAIGNPWIFREIKAFLENGNYLAPPTIQERVDVCRMHLDMSIQWKGLPRGINEMRRHYSSYLKGLPDIKPFRQRLVTTDEEMGVKSILDEVEKVYEGYEQDYVLSEVA